MDLAQFLQFCRLEHLYAALVDAGVEQVEDLRRYYHELKELSPADFREEMVATLQCKKIELSRLITAIDKQPGSESQARKFAPQKPPRNSTSPENGIARVSVASHQQHDPQQPQQRQQQQVAPVVTRTPTVVDLISCDEDDDNEDDDEAHDVARRESDTPVGAPSEAFVMSVAVASSSATNVASESTASEEGHTEDIQLLHISCSRRISVQQLHAISTLPFTGKVQKRAKYRKQFWHDRFLTIEGDAMYRFKSKKDFLKGGRKQGKVLELQLNSFAHRIGSNQFAVHAVEEAAPVMVHDKDDLFRWINVINAHVLRMFITAHGITTHSYEARHFPTRHYVTLDSQSRRHLGIRALPLKNGPRTGATIAPGEVVEVVGVFPPNANITNEEACFKLADDLGWVCQTSVGGKLMLTHAPGHDVPSGQRFRVADDLPQPLPVRFGPSFKSQYTGNCVPAGQVFQASRRWVTDGDPDAEFLKIEPTEFHDGGWVQVYEAVEEGDTQPARMLVRFEDPFGQQLLSPAPLRSMSRN